MVLDVYPSFYRSRSNNLHGNCSVKRNIIIALKLLSSYCSDVFSLAHSLTLITPERISAGLVLSYICRTMAFSSKENSSARVIEKFTFSSIPDLENWINYPPNRERGHEYTYLEWMKKLRDQKTQRTQFYKLTQVIIEVREWENPRKRGRKHE